MNLMTQANKDKIFSNIAFEYSKFSKCQFTKVGAIAVNENERIIATGVNGTISGQKNCCDHEFAARDDHVPFTREFELHAEANLVLELARSNINFRELSIYLTISPCEECFKLLLGLNSNHTKVTRVVYGAKYHRTPDETILTMKQRASNVNTLLYQLDEVLI